MAASPLELFRLEQIIYPKWFDAASALPLENQFLWMDLGQPERIQLFGLSIPLLAVFVVITTFLQSRLLQPPSSGNDQAAMMTKSMNIYMPVLMGFMAYSLASGLAIYFLTSNIFGIVQYALLGRANWSNIFPFLKKKEEATGDKAKAKKAPIIIDAVVEDEEPEPVKEEETTTSRSKQMMPKRKLTKRKN
jgi:YidC/Oxa1 family membrane protein insertase